MTPVYEFCKEMLKTTYCKIKMRVMVGIFISGSLKVWQNVNHATSENELRVWANLFILSLPFLQIN